MFLLKLFACYSKLEKEEFIFHMRKYFRIFFSEKKKKPVHFVFTLECERGYYGDNCKKKCGNCLNGEACDKKNGECLGECQLNFQPPLCDGNEELL